MGAIIENIIIGPGPVGLTVGYTPAKHGSEAPVPQRDILYFGLDATVSVALLLAAVAQAALSAWETLHPDRGGNQRDRGGERRGGLAR